MLILKSRIWAIQGQWTALEEVCTLYVLLLPMLLPNNLSPSCLHLSISWCHVSLKWDFISRYGRQIAQAYVMEMPLGRSINHFIVYASIICILVHCMLTLYHAQHVYCSNIQLEHEGCIYLPSGREIYQYRNIKNTTSSLLTQNANWGMPAILHWDIYWHVLSFYGASFSLVCCTWLSL